MNFHESNYTSNEELLTKLQTTKGQKVYDIIVPDADHVRIEKGLGLLSESGSPVDVALFKLEEARALIQLGRNEEAASLAMEATGLLAEGSPQDAGRGPGRAPRERCELGRAGLRDERHRDRLVRG